MRTFLLAAALAATGCYADTGLDPFIQSLCNGRLTVGSERMVEVAAPQDDISVIFEPLDVRILDLDHVPSDFVLVTRLGQGEIVLDPQRAGLGLLELTYLERDDHTRSWSYFLLDVRDTPPEIDHCDTAATPRYVPVQP